MSEYSHDGHSAQVINMEKAPSLVRLPLPKRLRGDGVRPMNLQRLLRHSLSITVLAIVFLFMASACGTKVTPEPEMSVDELLSSVAEELAAMSSAKFQMIDELESGTQFLGTTLKRVEGEVTDPASVRMLVDVVHPALGFVELEILAVEDVALMKFSEGAPWIPLPLDQMPFNFGELGVTLSELAPVVKDAAITGRESVGGAQTIRVDGSLVSEDLSNLITSADSGHSIALTLWIDEVDHTLRQLRIAGKIWDDDAPETTRLLIISGVNVPVDIQLPDIASGP